MTKKLMNMEINPYITLWILSFLTDRKQRVRFKNILSTPITTNTGAPQGCVLSPILFTLYTSDCRSSFEDCHIIKYADDTVLLGLFGKNGHCNYDNSVNDFVKYCNDNCLSLNVKKTN